MIIIYRLDAKSSRGMIYENEELRLRTININAEVERGTWLIIKICVCFFTTKIFLFTLNKGQSEIKHLKREREILRREIWTLRDEYDKLEKILKMKGLDIDEFLNNTQTKNDPDEEVDEDCSSCSCSSDQHEDEDVEQSAATSASADSNHALLQNQKNSEEHQKSKDRSDRLHVNFDHLSIVSVGFFADGFKQLP